MLWIDFRKIFESGRPLGKYHFVVVILDVDPDPRITSRPLARLHPRLIIQRVEITT